MDISDRFALGARPMGWAHRQRPGMLRESLISLLVLSLTFLNFNTASFAAVEPHPQVTTVTAFASFCGDHSLPGDAAHVVCHACRPV